MGGNFSSSDFCMDKNPRNSLRSTPYNGRGLLGYASQAMGWYRSLPQIQLTQAGVYYLAILTVVAVVAIMRQINLMLILAGMLLGPLIYNWRLTRRALQKVHIRRLVPQAVCAGDLVVVQLEVVNLSKRSSLYALRLVDHITPLGPVLKGETWDVPLFVPYLAPGEKSVLSYEGRIEYRGRYQFGPLVVATHFPFGLTERRLTIPLEDQLTVFPRMGKLTRKWHTRRREEFEGAPGRSQRQSRLSHEFYGVRGWQHGDSLRWIHWRSSARHGKLVVRQFCRPRNRDVALIVDLYSESALEDKRGHSQDTELVVSFAATLLRQLCREGGTNILLAIAGEEPWWTLAPASTSFLRVGLEHLAIAEIPTKNMLQEIWEEFSRHIPPGAEVLLVSVRQANATSAEKPPGELGLRELPGCSPRILRLPCREISEFFSVGLSPQGEMAGKVLQ